MICNPMGNPFWVKPQGIEMPVTPARFTGTVKTSPKYIVSGSLMFSPILNGGVGVVGGVPAKKTGSVIVAVHWKNSKGI